MGWSLALFDPLVRFLEENSIDPLAYTVIFFIYAIMASTVLFFPVEAGLLLNLGGEPSVAIRAVVLGAGMAVGSGLVFLLGSGLEKDLEAYGFRHKWFGFILQALNRFVAMTRYLGLYLILSIPGMVDTIPVYIFALFNRKGVMKLRYFALVNFFAGITRATLIFLLFYAFGIRTA